MAFFYFFRSHFVITNPAKSRIFSVTGNPSLKAHNLNQMTTFLNRLALTSFVLAFTWVLATAFAYAVEQISPNLLLLAGMIVAGFFILMMLTAIEGMTGTKF